MKLSYKTDRISFDSEEFNPVIWENLTNGSVITSNADLSTGEGEFAPTAFYNTSEIIPGSTATFRISLAYPNDDISINDEFPVAVNFTS